MGFESGINLYFYANINPAIFFDNKGLASCTYTRGAGTNGTLVCTFNTNDKKCCNFSSSAFSGDGKESSEKKVGGPIPTGNWKIYTPGWISKHPKWAYLKPNGHKAHGRTEFFIHGAGQKNIGCISVNKNLSTLIYCLTKDKGGTLVVK